MIEKTVLDYLQYKLGVIPVRLEKEEDLPA